MQRQLQHVGGKAKGCWCCPGHDVFPCDTYKNNRSKRARSRDKKVEHQYVRSILKRKLMKQLCDL